MDKEKFKVDESMCINRDNRTLTGIILDYDDGSMEYIEDGKVVVTKLTPVGEELITDHRILNAETSTQALFRYSMKYLLKEDEVS
jgi:hypothetical protein